MVFKQMKISLFFLFVYNILKDNIGRIRKFFFQHIHVLISKPSFRLSRLLANYLKPLWNKIHLFTLSIHSFNFDIIKLFRSFYGILLLIVWDDHIILNELTCYYSQELWFAAHVLVTTIISVACAWMLWTIMQLWPMVYIHRYSLIGIEKSRAHWINFKRIVILINIYLSTSLVVPKWRKTALLL